jgi:predicted deacylase
MAFFAPPIEIDPPDLSPYRRGNAGVEYVWSFPAPAPGPHVVLSALMHGNEICGAIALDRLLRAEVRPAAGKLTFVFANIAAYQSFDRNDPAASRYLDEDMNRIWNEDVLDGQRTSRELLRARMLRPVFDSADLLLDIHSMIHASMPLMLTGMEEKHLAFARRVGVPSLLVRDEGHGSGRRLRDYARFSDPGTPAVSLLVECGHHWSRGTAEVATETAWRFLAAAGILFESDAAPWLLRKVPKQQSVLVTHRVTADSENFRFEENFSGLEVIPRAGTVIARDGKTDIRTPYDNCVLIMPTRRISRGQTAVRLGRFES